MKLLLSLCISLFFTTFQFTQAQTLSNSERSRLFAEQKEKEDKVKDLFIGREIFVSADIYDKQGKKHRFYKNISRFHVDILSDGFYFSWDEERGDYSEDVTMLFSYSVKIPFAQINAVASYFSLMRHPIGTEKDYRKVASVVFQATKGQTFEIFEQISDIKNGKKVRKRSEYLKQEFILIPYANLDVNCSTCTHEKLTEKPRKVIIGFLEDKGY